MLKLYHRHLELTILKLVLPLLVWWLEHFKSCDWHFHGVMTLMLRAALAPCSLWGACSVNAPYRFAETLERGSLLSTVEHGPRTTKFRDQILGTQGLISDRRLASLSIKTKMRINTLASLKLMLRCQTIHSEWSSVFKGHLWVCYWAEPDKRCQPARNSIPWGTYILSLLAAKSKFLVTQHERVSI